MAEKRSAPIDDEVKVAQSKEAKVDTNMMSGFNFGLTKQIRVNCDGLMILDESFSKYSSVIASMRTESTYIEIPGDSIPSQTWLFINNFIVNRGFEGNPPTEHSIAQLFHVLEKYKINIQDIFLPKQYALLRTELLICIKNNMFKFNEVFNGRNLNMYFEFITDLFCESMITVIKQTDHTFVDGQKIRKYVENLIYCPKLQMNIVLNIISNFHTQHGLNYRIVCK